MVNLRDEWKDLSLEEKQAEVQKIRDQERDSRFAALTFFLLEELERDTVGHMKAFQNDTAEALARLVGILQGIEVVKQHLFPPIVKESDD